MPAQQQVPQQTATRPNANFDTNTNAFSTPFAQHPSVPSNNASASLTAPSNNRVANDIFSNSSTMSTTFAQDFKFNANTNNTSNNTVMSLNTTDFNANPALQPNGTTANM
uniref:Uncharacterized protein n=1 Tax=Lygus hesperus TaxID=30085 RepID=A0A146LQN1_LYGHE